MTSESIEKWTPEHEAEMEHLAKEYERLRNREQELNRIRDMHLTSLFDRYDIIDDNSRFWDALTEHADDFIEALQPYTKRRD